MTVDLSVADRDALVDIARRAVHDALVQGGREGALPELDACPPSLRAPGASFVTLRRGEALLGCIGTMEARQPLALDVAHNAWAAAFADPRLPAVTWEDLEAMSVKVSVLGRLEPLDVADRAALVAQVRPGVDGLLVSAGRHRGTFLPSVWEQIPGREQFLDALWEKAGMPPRTWPRNLEIWRYETVEFGD